MSQTQILRTGIFIYACIIFSLNESAGQSNSLPITKDNLQVYANQLIDKQLDSSNIILDNLSIKYTSANKPELATIAQAYQAKALFELNRKDEAKQLLEKLLTIADKNTPADLKFMIYNLLGEIEFQNGRFFAATQNYRSALELARSIRNDELTAQVNENLAKVFDKINRADRAVQFYTRSLKLYSDLDKKESMQACAIALGRIYLGENKLDSALYFIKQSISLSKSLKNTASLIEGLVEESNVFLKKKEFIAVSSNIRLIDSLMKNESSAFLKVRQFVLKGNHAMAIQGDSLAMIWYAKAEEFSRKGFTVFIDTYINSNIADAYYANGNIEKAYTYLKNADKVASAYSSKENKELAADISKNSELNIRDREIEFLKIQNQLKQEKLEKEFQIKQGLLRENILKDQTLKQELQLNEANTREQKLQQDQLDKEKIVSQSLSRENNFKQIALIEEKKTQNILWLGIVLLLCLGGLIFYLFNKQKEKNDIILKQKKDLEFINKEVHHRVKNNLQVISSLLDLQSQSNPDSGISNLLRESKHRVQSMAFIHQNLYEGEGMNLVDMPSYVQNLVDHLKTTFHNDSIQTEFQTAIDPMRLHMDTVVSVGMIINELVTNSLKYAFIGKDHGIINVKLQDLQNSILLTVEDDGHGIPEIIDVSVVKSFGYKMIRAFVQKLKAKLTIENEHGTKVQILFPKK